MIISTTHDVPLDDKTVLRMRIDAGGAGDVAFDAAVFAHVSCPVWAWTVVMRHLLMLFRTRRCCFNTKPESSRDRRPRRRVLVSAAEWLPAVLRERAPRYARAIGADICFDLYTADARADHCARALAFDFAQLASAPSAPAPSAVIELAYQVNAFRVHPALFLSLAAQHAAAEHAPAAEQIRAATDECARGLRTALRPTIHLVHWMLQMVVLIRAARA